MLAHDSIFLPLHCIYATVNIDDLFVKALEGNYDDDTAWNAIAELRSIGTREVSRKPLPYAIQMSL